MLWRGKAGTTWGGVPGRAEGVGDASSSTAQSSLPDWLHSGWNAHKVSFLEDSRQQHEGAGSTSESRGGQETQPGLQLGWAVATANIGKPQSLPGTAAGWQPAPAMSCRKATAQQQIEKGGKCLIGRGWQTQSCAQGACKATAWPAPAQGPLPPSCCCPGEPAPAECGVLAGCS